MTAGLSTATGALLAWPWSSPWNLLQRSAGAVSSGVAPTCPSGAVLAQQSSEVPAAIDDDDAALVNRFVTSGDSDAFSAIVRRHHPRVRLLLRQLSRDVALADDLAQDTFLRAYHKLDGFDARGSLIGWLLSIAYREFLQWHRRHARRDALQAQWPADTSADEPAVSMPTDTGDLDRLLAIVSEEDRALLLLNHGYGLSHAEVAAITGTPLGTVKSRLLRAMTKVRRAFNVAAEGSHE